MVSAECFFSVSAIHIYIHIMDVLTLITHDSGHLSCLCLRMHSHSCYSMMSMQTNNLFSFVWTGTASMKGLLVFLGAYIKYETGK